MNKQDLIDKIIGEFDGVFTGKLPAKFNHELDIRISTNAEGKSTIHATAVGISLTEDEFNQRSMELGFGNIWEHAKCSFCKKAIYEGGVRGICVDNEIYHVDCAPIEDFKYLSISNLPTKKRLTIPAFKGSGFSFGIKKINDNSFVVKISEDNHFARVFIDKNQAFQISEWLQDNLK